MYNGDEVIEEYASGSLTKSYILSDSIDKPIALILSPNAQRLTPEVYYYHSNAQQSIMALTDKSGAISESYSYDAYGKAKVFDAAGQEIVNSSLLINNYTYTGRRLDSETVLMYFRARYYSPELGRFISRDPLAFVDGMNLYAGYFAMWGKIDPMGLSAEDCPCPKTTIVPFFGLGLYALFGGEFTVGIAWDSEGDFGIFIEGAVGTGV